MLFPGSQPFVRQWLEKRPAQTRPSQATELGKDYLWPGVRLLKQTR